MSFLKEKKRFGTDSFQKLKIVCRLALPTFWLRIRIYGFTSMLKYTRLYKLADLGVRYHILSKTSGKKTQ